MTLRETELVIVGQSFASVVEDLWTRGGNTTVLSAIAHATSNRHHGCWFIVNVDVDGKECGTEVLRQERLRNEPLLGFDAHWASTLRFRPALLPNGITTTASLPQVLVPTSDWPVDRPMFGCRDPGRVGRQ